MSMLAEHMTPTPMLSELLRGIADAPDIPVASIASDSRQLREGYVFLAVQGLTSHGLDFLEQARQAGACAVVWDSSTGSEPVEPGVPLIAVRDLAQRVGEIADRFYGHPSERLGVIGVTGTNGKTTVTWMIAQAGELLGQPCGYIGTLGHGLGEVEGVTGMTTPPAVDLHRYLAEFVDQDAASAAIEVSSHALSQRRVDGVRFDTAIFTNLSRDHLDYHADMAEYFDSKARLFLECSPGHRIINVDSHYGLRLASLCGPDVVTVSTKFDRASNGRPFVSVRSVVANEQGSDVTFGSSWGSGRFSLPLPGDFNVANAASVLALLLMKGVAVEQACDLMSQLQAPPGRMQRVAKEGPAVFVDYAHTPSALEAALRALRAHCPGELWCVFGCGGDRDRGKRPQMGKAAERQGDHVVLTTDNPRSEDPAAIADDILAGMDRPDRVTIIEDRSAAIAWSIARAADDDVVLIAGKGHETYQEAAGKRVAISDYAIASRALEARGGAR
jgi:UDP-N-acetylmuramoyl-L-alanyl-D-glutamate--2,6-diaminopimelate ligase